MMITSFSKILSGGDDKGLPAVATPARSGNGKETKRANQHTHRRNAYPTNAWRPLSGRQKARLCILAREAFEKVQGRGPHSAAELEQFRHEQIRRAVNRNGLRDCGQNDYLPLKAHFLDLTGESGEALNAHLAHGGEERRLAQHKLAAMCAERGVTLGYAAAICRAQFKCALDDASPAQLWKLFFTLKTRRSKNKPMPAATEVEDTF